MNITTGTANIGANISGTGSITISGSAGTDMIWSGSDGAFTGSANIASGTLTLVNPTWFANDGTSPVFTGTTNVWNITAGAVMQWQGSGTSTTVAATNSGHTGIVGNGTFQIIGTTPIFVSGGNLFLGLSSAGVMEITSGATYVNEGGLNTGGSGSTPANLGTPQIDSGGVFNEWNVGTMTVGALTGSGTLTRIGFGNGGGSNFDFGNGGASGTFAGFTVTNAYGTTYIYQDRRGHGSVHGLQQLFRPDGRYGRRAADQQQLRLGIWRTDFC